MSRLPETQQSLSRWLRQRERTALRQRQTSAFARSGTSVTAEGAQSLDGTLTVSPVSGFVSIDGSLGVHSTAAFDGLTTIGGDLVVAGTLLLPNAIIGNAALIDPGVPSEHVFDSVAVFGLTTTQTVLDTITVMVPSGRTCADISLMARISAVNPNTTGGIGGTGDDVLYCRIQIGTVGTDVGASWSNSMRSAQVGGNKYGKDVTPHHATLTGLTPGSYFTIRVYGNTGALAWASNAQNVVDVVGTIRWLTWP